MTFENEDQAAQALFEAIQADQAERAPATPVAPPAQADESEEQAPAPDVQGEAESDEQGTTEAEAVAPPAEDSFTGLDPNSIPDELQPWYKSMQADYTRSKQALSERGKQFDQFDELGGVDAAREALDFVTRLATEPTYALEVHEELTKALVDAGHTPRQAAAEASRQIVEAQETAPDIDADDDLGFGVDPAMKQSVSALKAQVEEIRQWQKDAEERALQESMWNDMQSQHSEVVRDFKFNDEEMEYVYKLAYSTGGDLKQAASDYRALQTDILGNYVQNKSSVPSGVQPVPTGAQGVQPPKKFTDSNDPELWKLAEERLRQEGLL